MDIDYLLGFLADVTTKRLRRRLFNWQNEVEVGIEQGAIRVKDVPDLVATRVDEYSQWVRRSELKAKEAKREFVVAAWLGLLTLITIPEAIRKYFDYQLAKLELSDDQVAPGRDVAYIVHTESKRLSR